MSGVGSSSRVTSGPPSPPPDRRWLCSTRAPSASTPRQRSTRTSARTRCSSLPAPSAPRTLSLPAPSPSPHPPLTLPQPTPLAAASSRLLSRLLSLSGAFSQRWQPSRSLRRASPQARKRAGEDLAIVVAGCVAQQEGEALLRRVPEIDMVMGPQVSSPAQPRPSRHQAADQTLRASYRRRPRPPLAAVRQPARRPARGSLQRQPDRRDGERERLEEARGAAGEVRRGWAC